MSRFLTVPAGRTAKYVILAVCLVVLFASAAANLPGKYSDAENNESTSFLPGDAESTKVLAITDELQGGEQAPIVIVYRREGGLTAADRARIAADRQELNQAIEENEDDIYRAVSPFAQPRFSESGDAALLIGNITGDGDGDTILDPVDDIRDRVSNPGGGLEVKVTGPAGFAADAIKVFEGINGTLLTAALALVDLPAGPDLPEPDLPLDPAVRGRVRRGRDALDRLRADRDRRHGQRPVVVDPLDPRARRGHGLRAAAGLALPGGAAQARGQARGDGARAAHRRPGDRRVRRDGDLRAAVPDDRARSRAPPGSGRSARSASPSRWSRCSRSCPRCS